MSLIQRTAEKQRKLNLQRRESRKNIRDSSGALLPPVSEEGSRSSYRSNSRNSRSRTPRKVLNRQNTSTGAALTHHEVKISDYLPYRTDIRTLPPSYLQKIKLTHSLLLRKELPKHSIPTV